MNTVMTYLLRCHSQAKTFSHSIVRKQHLPCMSADLDCLLKHIVFNIMGEFQSCVETEKLFLETTLLNVVAAFSFHDESLHDMRYHTLKEHQMILTFAKLLQVSD